eukprot:scpid31129/ scgid28554/ 
MASLSFWCSVLRRRCKSRCSAHPRRQIAAIFVALCFVLLAQLWLPSNEYKCAEDVDDERQGVARRGLSGWRCAKSPARGTTEHGRERIDRRDAVTLLHSVDNDDSDSDTEMQPSQITGAQDYEDSLEEGQKEITGARDNEDSLEDGQKEDFKIRKGISTVISPVTEDPDADQDNDGVWHESNDPADLELAEDPVTEEPDEPDEPTIQATSSVHNESTAMSTESREEPDQEEAVISTKPSQASKPATSTLVHTELHRLQVGNLVEVRPDSVPHQYWKDQDEDGHVIATLRDGNRNPVRSSLSSHQQSQYQPNWQGQNQRMIDTATAEQQDKDYQYTDNENEDDADEGHRNGDEQAVHMTMLPSKRQQIPPQLPVLARSSKQFTDSNGVKNLPTPSVNNNENPIHGVQRTDIQYSNEKAPGGQNMLNGVYANNNPAILVPQKTNHEDGYSKSDFDDATDDTGNQYNRQQGIADIGDDAGNQYNQQQGMQDTGDDAGNQYNQQQGIVDTGDVVTDDAGNQYNQQQGMQDTRDDDYQQQPYQDSVNREQQSLGVRDTSQNAEQLPANMGRSRLAAVNYHQQARRFPSRTQDRPMPMQWRDQQPAQQAIRFPKENAGVQYPVARRGRYQDQQDNGQWGGTLPKHRQASEQSHFQSHRYDDGQSNLNDDGVGAQQSDYDYNGNNGDGANGGAYLLQNARQNSPRIVDFADSFEPVDTDRRTNGLQTRQGQAPMKTGRKRQPAQRPILPQMNMKDVSFDGGDDDDDDDYNGDNQDQADYQASTKRKKKPTLKPLPLFSPEGTPSKESLKYIWHHDRSFLDAQSCKWAQPRPAKLQRSTYVSQGEAARRGWNYGHCTKEHHRRTDRMFLLTAVLLVRVYKADLAQLGVQEVLTWLDYLRYAGVGHVLLYDAYHEQSESLQSGVRQYQETGFLTYIDWSAHAKPYSIDGTQVTAYQSAIQRYGCESHWQIAIDIDEYPFSPIDTKPGFLARYVAKLKNSAPREYYSRQAIYLSKSDDDEDNSRYKTLREKEVYSQLHVSLKDATILEVTMGNYLHLGAPHPHTERHLFGRYWRRDGLRSNDLVKPIYRCNPQAVSASIHHNFLSVPGLSVPANNSVLRMNHYWGARVQDWGPDTPKSLSRTIKDAAMKPILDAFHACASHLPSGMSQWTAPPVRRFPVTKPQPPPVVRKRTAGVLRRGSTARKIPVGHPSFYKRKPVQNNAGKARVHVNAAPVRHFQPQRSPKSRKKLGQQYRFVD